MSSDLAERVKLIGLSQVRLAELSGLDKHTVGRVLSGDRNVLRASEQALVAALEAEERRVLRLLLALHGATEADARLSPSGLHEVDVRLSPSGLHEAGVLNGAAA